MRLKEIEAKSIITPTKLPDADVVVNPYVGCTFGCGYCYASFMGRFVGEGIEDWGDYLYVKTNAVALFEREVVVLQRKTPHATLLMSSVTDAWQGPEKKYRLARGILGILVERRYEGHVSTLTKSPLVIRDLDLLAALPRAEVGVTITSPDDVIGRELEARAPAIRDRFETLRRCNEAGVPTYAFLGPLLPHFRYRPALLDDLFRRLADVGTTTIFAEHLNSSAYIRRRIAPLLIDAPTEVREAYAAARSSEHRLAIAGLVEDLVARHGFKLRLNGVIDHHTSPPAKVNARPPGPRA
jgi:DNA repair photolyase